MSTDASNCKKLVLSGFFDILKSQNKGGPKFASEAEFDKAMKKAIKTYKKEIVDAEALVSVDKENLEKIRQELKETIQTYDSLKEQARRRANTKLGLAFLTCFG